MEAAFLKNHLCKRLLGPGFPVPHAEARRVRASRRYGALALGFLCLRLCWGLLERSRALGYVLAPPRSPTDGAWLGLRWLEQ